MLATLKEYSDIIKSDKFKYMDKLYAHGNITVYKHSLMVALMCIKINRAFNLGADEHNLIMSALLHDLYLYDWHHADKKYGLHGVTHANTAAENAKVYFEIDDKMAENIRSHMWPLNITKVPRTKEAAILCIADKLCAIKETFTRK